ncbi:MAG: GrdX family protein [Halanaerobiales bacterium]|nr:GrdX family protein [Halanaerobiales bacterium]
MLTFYRIITNNPLVLEEVKGVKIELCSDLTEIMTRVRDYIHQGYRLTSHPLAGSVKPVQNPYRSIVINSGPGGLDLFSLQVLESARSKVEQFKESYQKQDYHAAVLADYQTIDLSLLKSCLKRITIKN